MGECIFSVDVEDWFHILAIESAPKFSEWESLPSFVEKNFLRLIDIFDRNEVKVTCFFLGWVAKKFPHLIKEAASRGHEIASHGYAHKLVYEMTEKEFYEDALKSKTIIEDITGHKVLGYRSSGFSVIKETPWFFEKLIKANYFYDSSVFPTKRVHGGFKTDNFKPYWINTNSGRILEFPITIKRVLGRPMCFFGGGYLRLYPYFIIRNMALKVLKEGRPVIFYIHPREIDPYHPRLRMSFKRRVKSYINLEMTKDKIEKILSEFEIITFERFISKNRTILED
jgi:polysaccharide deacetylase family protein (PEP-CTERM system associated)